MYRKILLAYDGAPATAAALRQSTALARLYGAQLHLLGVVATTGSLGIAESMGSNDVWGMEHDTLRQILESTARELHREGLTVLICVREGDPATELAAYARELSIDLVLLGHTGNGMLSRWFHDSVGAKLLDLLPCSLLVAQERQGR